MITTIAIITIFNNLVHHLLSVFCVFEAQVPENVIYKMQHLLVEKKKIRDFRPILVQTPGKDCSQHAGHGQNKEWHYLQLDSCIQKFVHLCLFGGMPDWHSKD